MKKKISVVVILAFLLLPISVVMMGGAGGTDVSAGMTEINNAQMDEAHKIWVQGHEAGGTDIGVASLMGVWQQESGLKAEAIQSGASFNEAKAMNTTIGGYAFGLAQWDSGRRVNLLNYAKQLNADWKDTGLQLDFAFNHDGSDSTLLKQLIKGTSITQTVTALTQKYERAGVEAMEQRISNANYWLNTMRNEGAVSTGQTSAPMPSLPSGWTIDKPMNIGNYGTESYAYKQCTWWVYNRAKEFGIHYDSFMGNGADWQNKAGYTVTTTPTLHSAVSFSAGQTVGGQWQADSTYGHVAFVESIHSDGSILISQSGTGFSTVFTYQVLSASQARQLHYVIGK